MDIRLWLIALMQDRSYPLRVRLARLNAGMHCMDVALTTRDSDAVSKLLSGETEIDTPVLPVHRNAGLRVVRELLERLDVMSHSIREYGELALRHFAALLRRYDHRRFARPLFYEKARYPYF